MDNRAGVDSDYIAPSISPAAPDYIPPDTSDGGHRVNIPSDQDWGSRRMRFPLKSDETWGSKSTATGIQSLYVKRSRFRCVGWWILGILIFVLVVAATALIFKRDSLYTALLRKQGVPPGLYSRDGQLYVGKDTQFRIKGFSWYGFEEPSHVPGGMLRTSARSIFEFANKYNFNAIRIPLSVESLVANPLPSGGITPFQNPELTGLPYMEMVLALVRMASEYNILILLDIHRLESHEIQSKGFWYSDAVPEERLLHVWQRLCDTFKDEWNVMGADLFNEPWDSLWNTTDKKDDWKRAAEKLGNTVHMKCPSWLLLVEGVGDRAGRDDTGFFWSENLAVMENAPPEVQLRKKVALSPHVYGPGIYMQPYFKSSDFPDNMPKIWDSHFGKASERTGLATVIGEWGGVNVDQDKIWHRKFAEYILKRQISFFYWCLNPESGDTGGLLKSDWKTPDKEKLALLDNMPSTSVQDNAIHFKYWRWWRT